MTRSKLTASDKQELIRLFKETSEPITRLAERFSVSISTARRVLKTEISAAEYEEIVTSRLGGRQGKRGDNASVAAAPILPNTPPTALSGEESPEESNRLASNSKPQKRLSRRRRSSSERSPSPSRPKPLSTKDDDGLDEEIESLNQEHYDEEHSSHGPSHAENRSTIEIQPIQAATFPQQCYLVIDRSAELITCPLKDFTELGEVPSNEEASRTLPVFENHKIASRFSRRNQRIIKVPNSKMLQKTYPQLSAKGIDRILFDGQVFSLAES